MEKFATHQKAIAAALAKREWTTYRLAKELAKSGISQAAVYAYMAGNQGLSVERIEAINKLLGIRYTDE